MREARAARMADAAEPGPGDRAKRRSRPGRERRAAGLRRSHCPSEVRGPPVRPPGPSRGERQRARGPARPGDARSASRPDGGRRSARAKRSSEAKIAARPRAKGGEAPQEPLPERGARGRAGASEASTRPGEARRCAKREPSGWRTPLCQGQAIERSDDRGRPRAKGGEAPQEPLPERGARGRAGASEASTRPGEAPGDARSASRPDGGRRCARARRSSEATIAARPRAKAARLRRSRRPSEARGRPVRPPGPSRGERSEHAARRGPGDARSASRPDGGRRCARARRSSEAKIAARPRATGGKAPQEPLPERGARGRAGASEASTRPGEARRCAKREPSGWRTPLCQGQAIERSDDRGPAASEGRRGSGGAGARARRAAGQSGPGAEPGRAKRARGRRGPGDARSASRPDGGRRCARARRSSEATIAAPRRPSEMRAEHATGGQRTAPPGRRRGRETLRSSPHSRSPPASSRSPSPSIPRSSLSGIRRKSISARRSRPANAGQSDLARAWADRSRACAAAARRARHQLAPGGGFVTMCPGTHRCE